MVPDSMTDSEFQVVRPAWFQVVWMSKDGFDKGDGVNGI